MRAIAKEKKVRGYYKLRKSDLIERIKQHEVILDRPVPDQPGQILKPIDSVGKKVYNPAIRDKITDWNEWLLEHVPSEAVDEAFKIVKKKI